MQIKKRHKLLEYIQISKYEQLLNELKKYIKNEDELTKIHEAYLYAKNAHIDQKRKNGDPYIYHPLSAAFYVAQWRMGPNTIIATLLHDILEDTPIQEEELLSLFGEEITNLVISVTKVSFFAKENRTQIKGKYLRKLYLSMAKDIRVIIIKIADRLHNMLTISNLREEKQKIIAKETLDTYSAIAHRIGMKNAKSLLEDKSFEILFPNEYKTIINWLSINEEKRNEIIDVIINDIEKLLIQKEIKIIDIFGRYKTIYSIYRKINFIGKPFEEITDLLAIRIITTDIDTCYKILGIIHQKYLPLRGKFKDYIATPKNNVYQSLHTTLMDDKANIFEVQIRTKEMDDLAETGPVAHWRYKEGEITNIKQKQKDIDEKLDIFRTILDFDTNNDSENDTDNNLEEEIKEDLFTRLVYALTPSGKVITLPHSSTILDFAYKIHSEIGEKTIGAKVNGIFQPINTILKSGAVIDIKTSSKQQPTYEWLKIAKTSNAKNKIRKFLNNKVITETTNKKEKNEILINKIENEITAYINKNDIKYKKRNPDEIDKKIKSLGYHNLSEYLLFANKNNIPIKEIVEEVYTKSNFTKNDELIETLKSKIVNDKTIKNDLLVNGITNIKIMISNCCMPIPYEDVVGFVSKNGMIKVHSKNCINIQNNDIKNKLISVQWNEAVAKNNFYNTKIKIYGTDRPKLLYDITKVLSNFKAVIVNFKSKSNDKMLTFSSDFTIKIKDDIQLLQIISNLKSLPSILSVERINIKNKNLT